MPTVHDLSGTKTFDVICAGESQWKLARTGGPFWRRFRGARLRPGGGPASVALLLARQGFRVGLATVVSDDDRGRQWHDQVAASGIDVDGVLLARPAERVVVVEEGNEEGTTVFAEEDEPPFVVPRGWSSKALVLSGLSPVVSHAAALCKAARAARRDGALVVLDFNAGVRTWAGHDARTILMVLREVDVAHCTLADLAVLGIDIGTVRANVRDTTVIVVGSGTTGAVATGPFGAVDYVPPGVTRTQKGGGGDAFIAAVVATLTRPGRLGESPAALWRRALQRGYVAANAHQRAAEALSR
ncbi:MAG: PfkB family carbohydrate kinase [Polyangiales bacterium]